MAEYQDDTVGWHRVQLNTIVRKTIALDSDRLRILPMGSRVYVIEQKERRVKINQPIEGWCSLSSSNGDQILVKLESAEAEVSTPRVTSGKHVEKLKKNQMEASARVNALRDDMKAALEKPELAKLYNDIQKIREQLRIAQAALPQLLEEKNEAESNANLKEELELQIETKRNEIQNFELQISDMMMQIGGEAKRLETENPVELQQKIEGASSKISHLTDKIKESEAIMAALELQNKDIKSMINEMGVSNDQSSSPDIRVGDVLKFPRFGMAIVEFVGVFNDEKLVGVCFDAPWVADDYTPAWPDKYPPLCDGTYKGEVLIEQKEPNQCMFFDIDDDFLKGNFITGSLLLSKLNEVMEQLGSHVSARD